MNDDREPALRALGLSGSPSTPSRSGALVEDALEELGRRGVETGLVALADLPADALLGRGRAEAVDAALGDVARADILVVGTPVYRATYAGLLKVFFDLMPQDALEGKVVLPIATGAAPQHALAVTHGLRPLFASVGGLPTAAAVYATDGELPEGEPSVAVNERVRRAAAEAVALATALRQSRPPGT